MIRILVVDDEPRVADVLAMVLTTPTRQVDTCNHPSVALERLADTPYDLLITDLRMPGMDGLALLERARALDPDLPVVLVTAHGSVPAAVNALQRGAVDFLEKPFDNDRVRTTVARALALTRLSRENRYLRAQSAGDHPVTDAVAVSEAMKRVFELARRAARSQATVLISGESGTGKELVARAVHLHSPRVGAPFVAVNCKALAAGLEDSELFGHTRGAFTGADRARAGLFVRAQGGTLFLDELGELSPDVQGKLLRVLQEREVLPVGADAAVPVDVRIVAATHRDLAAEVAAGAFREDLYYRLAVIPITVPPLRDRPADVLPLARQFLARSAAELGAPLTGWTEAVERWLITHRWPGNVRELENVMTRAAALCVGTEVTEDDLLLTAPAAATTGTLQQTLDAATRAHILRTLDQTGGARSETARRLGIDRTTLFRTMKRLGLD